MAGVEENLTHRVLPDGCIDVVWSPGGGLQVAGPNTTAFLTTLPSGSSATGIRLKPGAAPALLGVVAPELLDTLVAPGDLWGMRAANLEEAVGLAATPAERRAAIESFLLERVGEASLPDPLVAAVTSHLMRRPRSVAALADELGYSDRHLYRSVVAGVGYGPKRLARILRLQRALGAARAGNVGLARVAHESGYADQAHFSNECLALAGASPLIVLAG